MSKLEDLINELCPNGVEYKKFKDVIRFINGRAYKQEELLSSGKYKVLRVGNFFTSDSWYYSDLELDDEKYCNKGDLLYAWAASLGPKIWTEDKTIFHYHIWKLEFDEKILSKKYLYHFLRKDVDNIYSSLTHSTMPHVSMASMNEREIPVPPLPIQEEIVRILDNFTELTAELTARRKQYEYYRDSLLTRETKVEVKKMQDICDFVTVGIANSATHAYSDNGVLMFRNQNIKENYLDDKDLVYITPEFEEKYKNKRLKENDILVTRTGYPGVACVVPKKYEGCQTFTTLIARLSDLSKISPKYVCYYINSGEGKKYVNQKKSGAAQQNFGATELSQMPIPLPPLDVQERIVNVLDNFDSICTDLKIGLPAEIEARKKQYEYYRDLLLTFASSGNTILSEQNRTEQNRTEQNRTEQMK